MQRINYVLYDSRYHDDPTEASIYISCETLEDAKQEKKDIYKDAVIVRDYIKNDECYKSEIVG